MVVSIVVTEEAKDLVLTRVNIRHRTSVEGVDLDVVREYDISVCHVTLDEGS
jgi:hypothetical protein